MRPTQTMRDPPTQTGTDNDSASYRGRARGRGTAAIYESLAYLILPPPLPAQEDARAVSSPTPPFLNEEECECTSLAVLTKVLLVLYR